jgi:hypothetical protein
LKKKNDSLCLYAVCCSRCGMMTTSISVGKRPVILPPRPCAADDVLREVLRLNPPFVVKGPDGKNFSVRRRVFMATNGVRVECENEAELRMACKLSAEEHNQWQTTDDAHRVTLDTEAIEQEVAQRMDEPDDSPSEIPKEEEDISVEEWGQMGYKWFRREEVLYI